MDPKADIQIIIEPCRNCPLFMPVSCPLVQFAGRLLEDSLVEVLTASADEYTFHYIQLSGTGDFATIQEQILSDPEGELFGRLPLSSEAIETMQFKLLGMTSNMLTYELTCPVDDNYPHRAYIVGTEFKQPPK